MRKEQIASNITIFVQQNLYSNICTHNTSYGEIWSKGSNLTSLLLSEVFAEVAGVNTEALNVKSCQPWQKHCQGKAEAKCIFI